MSVSFCLHRSVSLQQHLMYDFSFDSSKVLIGTVDGKLRIYGVRGGALLHEIALVNGPVTCAALAPVALPLVGGSSLANGGGGDFEDARSLLFSSSRNDGLVKVSVLRDSLAGKEK